MVVPSGSPCCSISALRCLQQETRAARARSVAKVMTLFKRLDVDVTTRWRQAHQLVLESDEWKDDDELQKLPTLDILLAFEDYSRVREREFEEQMRRSQVEKTRRERKAREAFRVRSACLAYSCQVTHMVAVMQELLHGLVKDGRIKARTKWKEVYPAFAEDTRYLDILGNPGSNPLELFWDLVDELDQQLDKKIGIVEEAIKRYNKQFEPDRDVPMVEGQGPAKGSKSFKIVPETTRDELLAITKQDEDEVARQLSPEAFEEVFRTVRATYCIYDQPAHHNLCSFMSKR